MFNAFSDHNKTFQGTSYFINVQYKILHHKIANKCYQKLIKIERYMEKFYISTISVVEVFD